jgi:hypothetical protein
MQVQDRYPFVAGPILDHPGRDATDSIDSVSAGDIPWRTICRSGVSLQLSLAHVAIEGIRK